MKENRNAVGRTIVGAAFGASCLLFSPVEAAVLTSGCASATSCTLEELYAGGVITVGDVIFDSWVLNFDDSDEEIDPSTIVVTGVEGATTASLAFVMDPAVAVDDSAPFIEYDFDFLASMSSESLRTIVGAALEILDGDIGAEGGFDFFEVNAGLPSLSTVLSLDAAGSASTASLFSVLSLLADFDFQAESDGGRAFLNGFAFTLDLAGDVVVGEVPIPGAFVLMLTAMGGFGAMRRKAKRARA